MNWKKKLLKNFKLYAITDLRKSDPEILHKIDQAWEGGVDIIQLRSKSLNDNKFYQLAVQIKRLAEKRRKLFIVNDRIDLMLASGADGVHLGQDDLPIEAARKLVGKGKLIGISTHSVEQAFRAEKTGADYIGFGPLFATPTKPDYGPVGLRLIKEINQGLKIPCVCIGGINLSNVDEVVRAGGRRVAVVRAIFDNSNPKRAAQKLKQRIVE